MQEWTLGERQIINEIEARLVDRFRNKIISDTPGRFRVTIREIEYALLDWWTAEQVEEMKVTHESGTGRIVVDLSREIAVRMIEDSEGFSDA